jgi:hypothetical protein
MYYDSCEICVVIGWQFLENQKLVSLGEVMKKIKKRKGNENVENKKDESGRWTGWEWQGPLVSVANSTRYSRKTSLLRKLLGTKCLF